ncbi:molybdenum cofactor sulfurase [Anaeramoeba flamelloides]|uniref:Molybdenum cofactor sulfurase n=1 Tax=Anaeramoeba flamelloides TaxID=1746091 RepID=A0ABQ8YR38_9EUKA|nr:molybdenum cofactor sulfurase [Anaeramoeba flamelloides]
MKQKSVQNKNNEQRYVIILITISLCILGVYSQIFDKTYREDKHHQYSAEKKFKQETTTLRANPKTNTGTGVKDYKLPWLFQREKSLEYHSPELKNYFLNKFQNDYGYDGQIDSLVSKELSRLEECYLDYTGASLYAQSVIDQSFEDLSNNVYGNAHSKSPAAIRTEKAISQLRKRILKLFNADKREYSVIFTSGSTQSIKKVGESFPWGKKSKFVYLKRSHNSVVGVREYAKMFGNGFFSISEEQINEKNSYFWHNLLNYNEADQQDQDQDQEGQQEETYHLFAYPAESNFDGSKFDLDWINQFKKNPPLKDTKWMVLLDAAAYVPTNSLDLEKYPADFVALSLYKMFGYPTGLGVLLARNEAISKFNKRYWGGGTIILASDETDFCLRHPRPSTKFEDGTLPFLDIITAKYGLQFLNNLGFEKITSHVYSLGKFLYDELDSLRWKNGERVVTIYGNWGKDNSRDVQGGIVSFNILDPNGEFISYSVASTLFSNAGIQVRTGCHCNPGSCSKYFGINEDDRITLMGKKSGCSDKIFQVNNKWLGAIRASLGYLSTFEDIEYFLFVFKNKIMPKYDY